MSALNVATVAQFPVAGQRKDTFRREVRSFARQLRKFEDFISEFVEKHPERLGAPAVHDLKLTVESVGDSCCILRDIICELDGV